MGVQLGEYVVWWVLGFCSFERGSHVTYKSL